MKSHLFGVSLIGLVAASPATAQSYDASSPATDPAASPTAQSQVPTSSRAAAVGPDIIVTGVLQRTEADVLQGTSVLTGEALTRDLRPTIGETLARLPGVSATSFGPSASRPIHDHRFRDGRSLSTARSRCATRDATSSTSCPFPTQSTWRRWGRDRDNRSAFLVAHPDTRSVTDQTRFDRLTKRHRECLIGVRELKGSKEIAEELGIEKSTVDSYLTEAVKVLGARNRRDAALQLAEHEQRETVAVPPTPSPEIVPHKMGGHSARLAPPPAALPFDVSPDELVVGQPATREAQHQRATGFRLPYRRKGQADNDLSVGDRLIWIQVIAVGAAVGFGMLATGLQVMTTVLESFTRHLS